ncbi:MAG: 5'/3'-nucleotidase SurE [Chloroflexi bacterium]|nr:MAG: 5'/3'-nucleotidase SurE [Chloroflexota bacterium]
MTERHSQPYILITNDDGVDAPGLLALKKALDQIGETVVFAPDHNWSAAGHTKTMHKPLRVAYAELQDGSPAYASNGAPSDCVALALLGILERDPDLVISGINNGPNLGHDITYSGTVAAAMEAAIFGLPAIAVSLDTYEPPQPAALEAAASFAAKLASAVLEHGLPHGHLLNVNVPNRPASEIAGVEVTRLGRRVYQDVLVERQDPRGRPYYWIGGEAPTGVSEEGTDIGALFHGKISVTPIQLDMTAFDLIEKIRSWNLLDDP